MDVRGKRVLVVGLARSGYAAALALARHGAVVTVSDRKPPSEFQELLPALLQEKVGLELGSQRADTFLRHDMIVLSPGVPWDLVQLAAARDQKIPVYPEVEAASWFLEGTFVGITGSNGKTTTTALLGDMLRASGFPTFVGGNIGNALSTAADHAKAGTMFVTELSSFQLEGIQEFRPHVAVMLNLSPNHLDRHPSLEAYAQAKRQIFRNQRPQDFAILNADDPWVAGLEPAVASRAVMFSRRRELPDGIFVSRGKVYYRVRHLERLMFETRDVALRGDFNLEDVLAATAAACMLGADFAAIRKAVREFQAVEHRLEFVREIDGVDFYNNSKATSVDATAKSLEAFDRGIHLIMGGKDKGAPYTPLLPLVKERVRDILLIGAAAPVIAQQLAGSTEIIHAGDLATAVHEAFIRSRRGDTVLLAPACSSFDQFTDYEERGRVFKDLVNLLAQEVTAGRVSRQKPVVPVAQEPTLAPAVAVEPPFEELKTVAGAPFEKTPVEASQPAAQAWVETPLAAGPSPVEPVRTVEEVLAPAADEVPIQSPAPQSTVETAAGGVPKSDGAVAGESEPKFESETRTRESAPMAPQPTVAEHHGRSFIYEVEAIELPPAELESQEWPKTEPSTSGSEIEPVADGPLPFESRPEAAAVPANQAAGETRVNGSGRGDKDIEPTSEAPGEERTKLPGMD